jgi:2-succinyl-5-enolpyruvyl-6-hydroxy-3-cyclohexene-1-carboxylate synthase
VDERSAGFLALGLAKASGLPVPVVVTSGTAAANLLPAVVEADHAGVPVLLLTADRPPSLRGVGASQTIDQVKLYGDHVRSFVEVGAATTDPGLAVYWRSLVDRAAAVASHPADPGPVHLNLPFAEPLTPDGAEVLPALPGRSSGAPWTAAFSASPGHVLLTDVLEAMGFDQVPERGLVVVGDIPDTGWDGPAKVAYLADACGWPVIAEPSAGMHRAPTWLPGGPLVAGAEAFVAAHRPELLVSVGRIGLTRPVTRLLQQAGRHLVIDRTARWSDPGRTASAVLIGSVPMPPTSPWDSDGSRRERLPSPWLRAWTAASARAVAAMDEALTEHPGRTGLHAAHLLWRHAPDDALLYLGASWPIRQVYLAARGRSGLRVLSNRGANGIDGVVSAAWGAAVAHHRDLGGPTVAVLGDLTFLHDVNGLRAPAGEPQPPLTIVVLDNDGGGIFSQLEQAGPQYAADFERIFGTPHGLDLVAVAQAHGVPAARIEDGGDLAALLHGRPDGVRVAVVPTGPRTSEAELLVEIGRTVAQGLRR